MHACKTRAGASGAGDELYFLYVVSGTSFNVLGGDGAGAHPHTALPAIYCHCVQAALPSSTCCAAPAP